MKIGKSSKVVSLVSMIFLTSTSSAKDINFSVDIGINITGCGNTVDESVITYDNNSCQNITTLPSLLTSSDIDALHVFLDGRIIFSLKTISSIENLVVYPNDLILYENNSYQTYLSGEAMDIPKSINLNAVSILGDDVYFSVDTKFTANALNFNPATIILFNQTLSIYKSVSDLGLEAGKNIDALHVHDQGEIYISLDTIKGLDTGFLARSEIALIENSTTTTKFFSNLSENDSWYRINVDALHIDTDSLFKDNFEQ